MNDSEKDLEIIELKQTVQLYRRVLAGFHPNVAAGMPFICGSAGQRDSSGLSDVVFVCPALGSDAIVAYERTTKLKDVMLGLEKIKESLGHINRNILAVRLQAPHVDLLP